MKCPSCQFENRHGARGCRRCHRALPTLTTGDVVADRFEIQGLLGTGGMGVVFKARDRTLDDVVALKTLLLGLEGVEAMAARFRSEIRLARKVSSPHVCRIHEFGIDGELQFISMEWVNGITLKELLHESGGLPGDVALDIADQVLKGLVAIHDVGIMHRDLKPANLMRTRDGIVKLMDFGIAKEIGGVTLTAAGQAVGTPEYMSPEQVTGRKPDLRTDIYTAGIVLFELLTGVSPFHSDTPLETAHRQVTETPDFEAAGIPSPLVPVLSRALEKDRHARFPSAEELREALSAVRHELDIPTARSGMKRAFGEAPEVAVSTGTPAAAPTSPLAGYRPSMPRTGQSMAARPRPSIRRPSTAESQAFMPPPVTAVIQALRDKDPTARRKAVLNLGELGPRSPAAVKALAGALRDPDRRIRFMAAAALGRIGPAAQSAVPALLRTLDDESAGNEAAESLVKIGKAAVPTLLEVMRSGHRALSSRAASTLTRIGASLNAPSRE